MTNQPLPAPRVAPQSNTASMEVSYSLTPDDLVALNLHLMRRSPSYRRRFVIGWVLVPTAFVLAALAASVADAHPAYVVCPLLGAVLLTTLYPFLYRWNVRRQVRAYGREATARGALGRTTLVLTDDTLTVRTKAAETVARWEAMRGVTEDADYIYIHLSAVSVATVPRRDLDGEQYAAVRDFARAKLRTFP